MGTDQHSELDRRWQHAAALLDAQFPLAAGSHQTAVDYWVHFDHLLVVCANGTCTGLADPSQFAGANGNKDAPHTVVLADGHWRIEIEPQRQRVCATDALTPDHRMQLLTTIAPSL